MIYHDQNWVIQWAKNGKIVPYEHQEFGGLLHYMGGNITPKEKIYFK